MKAGRLLARRPTAGTGRMTGTDRALVGSWTFAAVLLVVGALRAHGFISLDNLHTLLLIATFVGLAGLGQTLVVLGGGIDLSLPWMITLGGIGMSQFAGPGGAPPVLVAAGLVLAGALAGCVNGAGVTRLGIPPIVMTLGVGGLVQGLLVGLAGRGGAAAGTAPRPMVELASARLGFVPVVTLCWLAAAVAMGVFLKRTPSGRRLYATGANPQVAHLAGIRTGRVVIATYAASAMIAVLTGMLMSGYLEQSYLAMGAPYLFTPIAAVAIGGASVLGGRGTSWGTTAGAIVITLLGALLPLWGLGGAALQIVYGAVILAGVLMAKAVTRAG
ncbi:ABC transporter permease [Actinomadura roseirufa]|uniref:ABC transporter permease n=1 Tax=Actinomadura roseirufa TaxID=2094049 RepID=UPI0010419648|nr:ABC transporter permease [Actinomadura roseirufa]